MTERHVRQGFPRLEESPLIAREGFGRRDSGYDQKKGSGDADESYGAIRRNRSPVRVSERARTPDGNSITANPRQVAAIRHGFRSCRRDTAVPSRATKTTSMANRMKNVWIAFVGAMTRADPSGIESCLRSPVRRDAESNAGTTSVASTLPFRSFSSRYGGLVRLRSGSRKVFALGITQFASLLTSHRSRPIAANTVRT